MTAIESSDFYIQADRRSVEAWTPWYLPFMRLKPEQRSYRAHLRDAIRNLEPADRIQATSIAESHQADVENLLFYNVGAAPFRNLATRTLRFDRIDRAPPSPTSSLGFAPRHYVRYHVEPESIVGAELAHCRPVILKTVRELYDQARLARLWWVFKRAIETAPGAIWKPGDRFGVRLHLSAPASWRLNLADIVKPLMDGFISALHSYKGNHADAVAERIATLLAEPVPQVLDLLLDDGNALLGTRAVPNLFGNGLQWSPADHLLIVGEVCREISAEDQLAIHGCLFKPAQDQGQAHH